jgi:hypothetical protein
MTDRESKERKLKPFCRCVSCFVHLDYGEGATLRFAVSAAAVAPISTSPLARLAFFSVDSGLMVSEFLVSMIEICGDSVQAFRCRTDSQKKINSVWEQELQDWQEYTLTLYRSFQRYGNNFWSRI